MVLLLLFVTLSAHICDAGWTQRGGSASRNSTQGLLGALAVNQGKTAWNVSAPFRSNFFGSPVVDEARGRVFIAGVDGYVYAFSTANGTRLWRVCFGKHGTFPSSPCTGFELPQGLDYGATWDGSWYLSVQPQDGSIVLTARLHDQPKEPPYGYNDQRAAVICLNGTNGATLWIVVSGYFNPLNADSAKISPLLLHPSGDIFFWQTTNGTIHLVRLNMAGKVVYNITGSNGVTYNYADKMTYIEDDDSIWTNIHQDGGIAKLKASDGSIMKTFTDNVLDSMGLPFSMVYDRKTKLVHFGRVGNNQAFALDAITGDAVWQIPVTDAGWPTSAVLCSSTQRVVYVSDDGLVAAWDAQSAENQKPIWQVAVDDPPPIARQLVASMDEFFLVDYGSAFWFFNCDGKLLWKQAFNPCDGGCNTGPALGNNEIYWNTCVGLFKIVSAK